MLKKKSKLTPEDYLKKMFAQRRAIQGANSIIQRLDEQWIKEHCPFNPGQTVEIKGPNGHTHFTIGKVHVDVSEVDEKMDENGKIRYSIGFSFTGVLSGEGLENENARIKLNTGGDEQADKSKD